MNIRGIAAAAVFAFAAMQGTAVHAEWANWADSCDSSCRANLANPKPPLVSPLVGEDGSVTINYFAPDAESVSVSGLGGGDMTKGEEGVWSFTSAPQIPGWYEYQITVDGIPVFDTQNLWLSPGRITIENVVEVLSGEDFARNDPSVPHGAIADVYYRTPGVEFERRMRVYTPPHYGMSEETLPVLYLMHGGGGSETSWGNLGRAGFIIDNLLAQGLAKRMILVMIDGYVDDLRLPSGAAPDLSIDDVINGAIPHIEASYRVSTDPKDRAIAGLSRGATQTFMMALEHPDAFNYFGIFSLSRSRVEALREAIEGLTDEDLAELRDDFGQPELIYWSVGTEDAGHDDSQLIWQMFDDSGVPVIHEALPGDHEWMVWRINLRDFAQKLF